MCAEEVGMGPFNFFVVVARLPNGSLWECTLLAKRGTPPPPPIQVGFHESCTVSHLHRSGKGEWCFAIICQHDDWWLQCFIVVPGLFNFFDKISCCVQRRWARNFSNHMLLLLLLQNGSLWECTLLAKGGTTAPPPQKKVGFYESCTLSHVHRSGKCEWCFQAIYEYDDRWLQSFIDGI